MRHKRQWRWYETEQGAKPAREFVRKLDDYETAEVMAAMKEVEIGGAEVGRHLRAEIYEVRAETASHSYRLLFATEGKWGQVLLALSIFDKNTDRTPPREIELAMKRLASWRARGAKKR